MEIDIAPMVSEMSEMEAEIKITCFTQRYYDYQIKIMNEEEQNSDPNYEYDGESFDNETSEVSSEDGSTSGEESVEESLDENDAMDENNTVSINLRLNKNEEICAEQDNNNSDQNDEDCDYEDDDDAWVLTSGELEKQSEASLNVSDDENKAEIQISNDGKEHAIDESESGSGSESESESGSGSNTGSRSGSESESEPESKSNESDQEEDDELNESASRLSIHLNETSNLIVKCPEDTADNNTARSDDEINEEHISSCEEVEVQLCVTSQTPTSFNSDNCDLHLDMRRKPSRSSGCLQKSSRNSNRLSMSFSNERIREIERHNQILLRKILTQKASKEVVNQKKLYMQPHSPNIRTTASAVNRRKQQRQIDLDNQVLKKKIEAISLRRPKIV